ncbi:hypothetical protein [Mycobacterium leprae]|uniref:hypothetical protein n=1 Tax=Mycobacterium leprae TaxID=1769 RepID=UPI000300C21D|nr:hypothetical protein [Mycobacterium leprae]
MLVRSNAAAAMVIAVRELAGTYTARRAASLVAVEPTAIWGTAFADGYFADVATS